MTLSSSDSRPAAALLPLPIALPLAVASGALMAASFAPYDLAALAPVAVAGSVAALIGCGARRAFLIAFCGGLTFFAILMPWLTVVGPDAWVLLSAFCALWFGLAGIGIALVTRLPGWPWWVAGVWVLQESLRGRIPFGGFPWGRLAYGQPDTPVGRLAWLLGQPGVSFGIVLAGCAVVAGLLALRDRQWRRTAGWAGLAMIVLVGPALIRLPVDGDQVRGAPSAVIAAVQGGTPGTGLDAMDVRRAVLDNHVAQTIALAAEVDAGRAAQPAFVLWPENSSDIDPFVDAQAARSMSMAARAVGAPILVGAVVNVPGNPQGVWNLGVVWDPERGPGQRYIKTHPVPFGEYVPFRSLLASVIDRFDQVPRDFVPGTKPGNMQIGGVAVGNVICFEVAYDDVIDPVIARGARVITVQTNNATYQGTGQPAQQLQIARMRAIQTSRSVVVAATSGISAFIEPDGTVRASLGETEAGYLDGAIALRGSASPSSLLGPAVEWVLVLIGLGPIAWVIGRGVRARRRRLASARGRMVGA